MRRIIVLLVFAILLIALTLGWFFAAEYLPGSAVQSSVTSQSTPEDPLLISPGAITRIQYTYNGESIDLTLNDDVWQYTNDPAVPIHSKSVQAMVNALTEARIRRTIEPAAGESYGFTDDSLCVLVHSDEGKQVKLTFGGVNEVTSQVYARINDETTLYMLDVSVADSFCLGFLDLIQTDAPPDIAAYELDRITITRGNHILELSYHPSGLPTAYSTAFTWFIGKPYDELSPADTRKSHALFNDITNFYIYGCVAYQPDAESLESMGLISPRASITVEYTLDGKTLSRTFHVGAKYDETKAYIRFEDSDQILLADAGLMESIIYTSGSSLLPDAVCLIEQGTVTDFTVEQDGRSVHYVATSDGYTRDGEAFSADAVDRFFACLNDMASIKDAPDNNPSEIYASIRFLRSTQNHNDMTLTFYRFDADTLLVGFDGRTKLLVWQADVDAMLALLEADNAA